MKQELTGRRFLVNGRVQGVGYRNYVEHVAENLDIQGYVRNRRDGSVEVFAMGSRERLRELRQALQKGPLMSRVREVVEEPSAVDESYLGQFTIEVTV